MMAGVLKHRVEMFPPTDRELALRGQIRTGWSTVSSRRVNKTLNLNSHELKHIKEVLRKAAAFEHQEEIRVGIEILKHKQMEHDCHGNGTTSCRICGYDFAYQHSRKPLAAQFCNDCGQAVCPRCKSSYKSLTGESLLLCRICYDERELWKRSGAWLNSTLPVISVPEDELEKIQQQLEVARSRKVTVGRRDSAPREFINPFQIEDEDSEEDDLNSSVTGGAAASTSITRLDFTTASQEGSSILPSLAFTSEFGTQASLQRLSANAARKTAEKSATLPRSRSGSGSLSPQHRPRSGTDGTQVRHLQSLGGKSRGLNRKGAMSRKDKLRLDDSRKRLRDRSSDEQSAKEDDTTTSSGGDFPVIKPNTVQLENTKMAELALRKISTSSTGFTPTPVDSDASRTRSPDSMESDSPPATVIHQRIDTTSDSDHTIPIIGESMMQLRGTPPSRYSQTPPSTDVEVSPRPEIPLPLERKRKPVPVPRRRVNEEEERAADSFDEFRKIEVSSVHKMKSRSASPPDASTAAASGEDIEFKKVGVTSPKQPDIKPMIVEPLPVPASQPIEKPLVARRRPKLREVEKQSSITSTISTTSSVMSEGFDRSDYVSDSLVSQSSFDSVDYSESFFKAPPPPARPPPVRKEEVREVEPVVESTPVQEDDQSFDWKRRSNRRVARRGRSGIDKPSPSTASVEQEEDETSSRRFRMRSRALDKDAKPGGMTRPKRFQRARSPLTMEQQQSGVQTGSQLVSSLEVPGENGSSESRGVARKSHPKSASFGAGPLEGEFVRTAPRRGRSQSPSALKPEGAYGSIEAHLEYVEEDSELKVTIVRCKGLRSMDNNGYSDPYVKLFLQPGHKMHQFQTRTVYKSLNPEFNDCFTFMGVTADSLKSKELCLIAMDYDEFKKDDFIGSTRVKLYEVLLAPQHKITLRRLLDDRSVPMKLLEDKERGKLRLTFSYNQERQVFVMNVMKATNLLPISSKGLCDSYVKCHLECKNISHKRKTAVCRKTINPEYNELFQFNIMLHELHLCQMTVTVWDHKIMKDVPVGEIQFKQNAFWKGFTSDPLMTLTNWYSLEPSTGTRTRSLSTVSNSNNSIINGHTTCTTNGSKLPLCI